MRPALLLSAFALLLGGCASVTRFNGLALEHGATYVSGVTPILQDEKHGCGAACVATVATHWGMDVAEFNSRHRPKPADTTGRDLQAMAEELGLRAFAYAGSMEDLRDNLGKGRPLIVMIPMPIMARGGALATLVSNAWNEFGARPAHWVVVMGLIEGRHVIVHDPFSGPLMVRQAQFQEWWAQEKNLCVLVAREG